MVHVIAPVPWKSLEQEFVFTTMIAAKAYAEEKQSYTHQTTITTQ